MSYRSATTNTEHNGPKRGMGAWCRKWIAKKASNRLRRAQDKRAAGEVR